jgi:DNA repair protein RadD
MLQLRDYQSEPLEAAIAYLRENPTGRPLIAVPTGGGKSLMSAEIMRRVHTRNNRMLYLTMTQELITQTLDELKALSPEVMSRVTVACAGLGKTDFSGDIVLGTAQTVVRNLGKLGARNVILVDEAHGIPRDQSSMYGKIMNAVLAEQPKAVFMGLTGTPYRLDSGRLDEGKGAPFSKLVYQVSTRTLQDRGFLSKLTYRKPKVEINAAGVHVRRGDFVVSELESIALNTELCKAISADIQTRMRAGDRKCMIVFCISIEHATMMADALRDVGINAASLSSEDDKLSRKAVISAMRNGELEALCNVMIASTGFNVPHVDMIAHCRPTMSTGLWVQQVGRGLRVAPGKTDCLVVDYAGNTFRHGPVEDIERGAVKPGNDRAKICLHCEAVVSRSATHCPECGEAFPAPQARLVQPTSLGEKLGLGVWVQCVGDRRVEIHHASSGRDALRVRLTGADGKQYSLWLSFIAEPWARSQNRAQWLALGGKDPFPSHAASAYQRATVGREIMSPRMMRLKRNKRGYIDVVDVEL